MNKILLLVSLTPLTLFGFPQLRLSSNTIGPLVVDNGQNPPGQTIDAYNLGDGVLNLAVTSISVPWLTVALGQGTTCPNGPVPICYPINITVNTSGLAIGTYSANFTLNDPTAIDAPQTVTVIVQVNGAPTSATLYVTPNNGAATAQSDNASQVVNTGSAVISVVNTTNGGPWLTFTLTGNHVTYSSYLLRAMSQIGQAEGSYTGTVILSGSPNPADDKSVNVTMVVTSQPIVQIPTSPLAFNLVQGQAAQSSTITFQNLGFGSLAITGATVSNASWLTVSSASGTNLVLSANPAGMNPGNYAGTITLVSNAANTSVVIPVQLNVAAVSGPTLNFSGVVDNAAYKTGLASGSIAAVFGTQLTGSAANAGSFPLPTTLGGVQLLMNGTAVPLFYVGPNQIDFQVPYNLTAGQIILQEMLNGMPSNQVSATVNSVAPRLFITGQTAPDGTPYGVVFNSDQTPALPNNLLPGSHPAHLGDVMTIYLLGLGPVAPPVQTGQPAAASPLSVTTSPVQVNYGGQGTATVSTNAIYAGLAPFFAGLYQIDALLPQTAPTGTIPVSVTIQGVNSNMVDMTVGPM